MEQRKPPVAAPKHGATVAKSITVKQLRDWLDRFSEQDIVLIYDPDMKEFTNVADVSRRTSIPICVQITVGRE